ncbi:HlyD family efflux transporter periplasmic adaptor subunit [Parabacteroides sp. OttesenSCG-928-G06]|nr:HlyD family efflux transporter periplasmic adaptor subunit [Parabacteroides sp. OttesenSCG-928-G06]
MLYLSFLFFLSACALKGEKEIPSYIASITDFKNILLIDGYVEPVRSTTLNCPMYIEGVVAYLVEDGTMVEEGDVVCIVEVQELQIQYDQMLLDLENSKAGLNKTKADLNMQYALLEAQVRNNDADTRIAELDSLQLIYSTPNQKRIKELELEKALIQKAKFEKKLQALEIIQQSEVRKLELQIKNYSNRIQSIKGQLDALTLKAPRKGLAMRPIYPLTGAKLTEGDPVWSNMPLVTIPEFAEMKVKIMAPEKDVKLISMGDSIHFTFDAQPGNEAWGKITKKAPVGQPYKRGSKVKFYELEASIDSASVMPEPGFTANCHILLKEIQDVLVVPQIAVFDQDSIKVVYVEKKRGYEMRQVKTGLSSQKETIITDGLEQDEKVVLSRPDPSRIKVRTFLPADTIASSTPEIQAYIK